MTTITRPALRYYGGKWRIAPWVISHFPPHINYLEPCGGAASVLLQKPPSKLETYNDLDNRIVNFFQVLRDRPDELINALRLTPWARAEFEACQTLALDPLENARRFAVLCWQSVSKPGGSWRVMYNYADRPKPMPADLVDIDHLHHIAQRLKQVQIECKNALKVIEQYDNPDSLIYFDPPYLPDTRVNSKNYYHVDQDEQFHHQAAEVLHQAKGLVVISGYAHPLYQRLFEARGWPRFDKRTQANSGAIRVESVWLSPRTYKALNNESLQRRMF